MAHLETISHLNLAGRTTGSGVRRALRRRKDRKGGSTSEGRSRTSLNRRA
uniref:Uncharacterized protein n=1 Tax=Arundo donax TaxID=35708 RepID=A0A0A8YZI0_ARUDO